MKARKRIRHLEEDVDYLNDIIEIQDEQIKSMRKWFKAELKLIKMSLPESPR